MKYLISPNKAQYKANLHCHSTLSDGARTPEELKEMYRNAGYRILAITDHERPAKYYDPADRELLMITGYEAYIRPNHDGRPCGTQSEIHINLFAKNPNNVNPQAAAKIADPMCCS